MRILKFWVKLNLKNFFKSEKVQPVIAIIIIAIIFIGIIFILKQSFN